MSRTSEIQSAAIDLFYQRGYNATSLKNIADVVKLRAPSLYNHIESKQKLLQDIMFDGIDLLRTDFEAAIAAADDPVEQLRLVTAALIKHNVHRQKQAYVNTVEIPSLDEPARLSLIKRRRNYIDGWVQLIERGIATGVFVTPEPMLSTFNIIDLVAGVATWYQPLGNWSEAALIDHYTRAVFVLVGAPAAAVPAENRRAPRRGRKIHPAIDAPDAALAPQEVYGSVG